MACPVTIVDVDDSNAGRARVQHRQQRRNPAERRAVTHRCGQRHDRGRDQARDHAGEGAVHAGRNDDHAGSSEQIEVPQDPVQPGDPDVNDQ